MQKKAGCGPSHGRRGRARSIDALWVIVVPEMQIKLKKGFGRAIRTETDTCDVAILDERSMPGQRYFEDVKIALGLDIYQYNEWYLDNWTKAIFQLTSGAFSLSDVEVPDCRLPAGAFHGAEGGPC